MPKPEKLFTTPPLKVVRLSELAVKFQHGAEEPFWLPRSTIYEPEDYEFTVGEELEITISDYWAKQKGLD